VLSRTKARRSVWATVARGIPLLGQSVLLRGVNDTPEAWGDLSEIY
jgi:L-lysine 2,3-aminomutase